MQNTHERAIILHLSVEVLKLYAPRFAKHANKKLTKIVVFIMTKTTGLQEQLSEILLVSRKNDDISFRHAWLLLERIKRNNILGHVVSE